jgi:hypothetical protein
VDKDRKCFRLVGDVLVERTVGETMPAVAKNKENLEGTIQTLQAQLNAQKKDLNDFQTKNKIRVRRGGALAGGLPYCRTPWRGLRSRFTSAALRGSLNMGWGARTIVCSALLCVLWLMAALGTGEQVDIAGPV